MANARNFFTKEQQNKIVEAIREAELNTSGEIRVHLDNLCRKNVLDRAVEVFGNLKMDQTAQRNGVLFYMSVKDRKFAIIGDEGINKVVESDFWEDIKNHILERFAKGDFVAGLSEGISRSGAKLKKHFPLQPDDVNELSDEISFDK